MHRTCEVVEKEEKKRKCSFFAGVMSERKEVFFPLILYIF